MLEVKETNVKAKRFTKEMLKQKLLSSKALIIIFSLGFAFSTCIFNQQDVLFHNQIEFGIQPQEVIWGFLLFFVIAAALCMAVLYLTNRFLPKAFKVVLAVLLGIALAGYVQVLFLNGRYNGAFEDFAGDYTPIGTEVIVINIIIWVIVALLPLGLLAMEKKTRKDFFKKTVLLITAATFVMQVVGLCTAAPYADFRRYDKSFYFSVDKQLDLSTDNNIVVFLLDRAATGYTDEVFEKHPESKNNFEGFTYYRDNISEYSQTFPSVIAMFTGTYFTKSGRRDTFSRDAWQNAQLFAELKNKNYTVNGLLDQLSTYYNYEEIADKFTNIELVKEERKVSQYNAVSALTKISLQRTLPYALKESVGFDYPKDLNNIVGFSTADFFPSNISASSDARFAQKVDERGLTTNNQQNTFSFVHLNCSHELGWQDATLNIFNMLGRYFNNMKQLGIYKNSTIILVSDHGARGYGRNASLFIKRKGESDGAIKIDSASKLSNGFFLSTMFELIGAEDKKVTPSYFDIIDRVNISGKGLDSNRYYYSTVWNVGNHCTYSGMEIIDNSVDY